MKKTALLLLSITFSLTACTATAPTPTETLAPTVALAEYHTPTATLAATEDNTVPTATAIPLPTGTPIVVEVKAGDTLLAIASRFGVKLNDLLTANPSIDPQFLSVGTLLQIPQLDGDSVVSSLPQPTPIPLLLSAPTCTADAAGGLWCVSIVENLQMEDMENVVVLIQLLDDAGQRVASETGTLLLNRLPAGEAWPVLVHFAPPLAAWQSAAAQLNAALPVAEPQNRYLPVTLTDTAFVIGADGKAAKFSTTLTLAEQTGAPQAAAAVYLMAVAYDADKQIVGVMRWQSDGPLEIGEPLAVSSWVYSLGSDIVTVQLFAEALP